MPVRCQDLTQKVPEIFRRYLGKRNEKEGFYSGKSNKMDDPSTGRHLAAHPLKCLPVRKKAAFPPLD